VILLSLTIQLAKKNEINTYTKAKKFKQSATLPAKQRFLILQKINIFISEDCINKNV